MMTFPCKAIGLPAIVLCVAVLGSPVLAGGLVDAATKAESLAASGDVLGARDVMREALSDFSQSLPFVIGKAVFITKDPAGYGMYSARDVPSFKTGESLVSYVEPAGLTWKPSAEKGKIETHFTVDFDILNPAGDVLASQKSFGNFTFTGFFRNLEIYSTLTIDVTGAPVGDYVLRFHFNDINGNRTASVDQTFKIIAP